MAGGSASALSLSRPAQASHMLRPTGSLSRPRRPLSRGSSPSGRPAEPLVSYQIDRQFSGWILPPQVIRAFGRTATTGHAVPARLRTGPTDGCALRVRRGARDLRDDGPKLRGLCVCVCLDTGKSSAGQEPCRPQIRCSEGSRRALPAHLVNKAPKEHPDVRKPSYLGNVGQHRPLVMPR
jgi:hypothetical protein